MMKSRTKKYPQKFKVRISHTLPRILRPYLKSTVLGLADALQYRTIWASSPLPSSCRSIAHSGLSEETNIINKRSTKQKTETTLN